MERSGHGTKNSFLNMLNLKCLLAIHKELLSRVGSECAAWKGEKGWRAKFGGPGCTADMQSHGPGDHLGRGRTECPVGPVLRGPEGEEGACKAD